jgi:hypothetical protein
MTLQQLQRLSKLPPRQYGAAIAKEVRSALRKGECDQALFLLHLGKTPKILSRPAWNSLRARVDACKVR